MSLGLYSLLTNHPEIPLSQHGEALFKAIETRDLQWLEENKENLVSTLFETKDHKKEGPVTPLMCAAIKGNFPAFKTLFNMSNHQELCHLTLLKMFIRFGTKDSIKLLKF